MMSKVECVVVLSGGQDSATCLLWAVARWGAGCVLALAFDYGQRHRVELACARALCERLGVALDVVPLPLQQLAPGNALTDASVEVALEGSRLRAILPTTFVPGRNLMFLTAAASYALARGVVRIVTGVCETDFSGYPDCRESTIKALELALTLGTDCEVEIITPLMHLSKAHTWQLAARSHPQGVAMIIQETHTCYKGDHDTRHVWGYGCNDCPACALRAKGYEEFMSWTIN